jgi:DNA-binding IclR family transcriptional regulator
MMVKSAVRVFDILSFISKRSDGALHSEISQVLRIPRGSLTALLNDLLELGYVVLDKKTRRYTLGAEILTLSNAYLRNLNIVQIGDPILRDVFNEVHEFTSLVIAKDTVVVKVCEYAAPDPLGYHLQVGESGPMHATAGGKAILAHLPIHLRNALVDRMDFRIYTTTTIRTKAALLKELSVIRAGATGYCREEYLEGMISMARPVFNADELPVAAIGVNTRSVRFTRAHERKVDRVLRIASARLSERLGSRSNSPRLLADAVEASPLRRRNSMETQ